MHTNGFCDILQGGCNPRDQSHKLIWGSLFKLTSSWPPARVEVGVRAAVDDTWLAGAGDAGAAADAGAVFQTMVSCTRNAT